MKRTPFYGQMVAAGASMAEVQGWEMPNEFAGARAEHLAVRQKVGLSDWSSTGEIEVAGPDALALVQRVIVNDAAAMPVGRVLYSTMCREDGTILSDITVYRFAPDRFWLMTAWGSNRANQRIEYDWLLEHRGGLNACVTALSSGVALLAVQGPLSRQVVSAVAATDLVTLPYMDFRECSLAGAPRGIVSRTGYTGELGYELIVPAEHGNELWDTLVAASTGSGMALVGLKAAFSLRIEKGYIARFDFADHVTPIEAGLGWTIKHDKGDFIGRQALRESRSCGVMRRLVTLEVADDHIPAAGEIVRHDGTVLGKVTSGGFGWAIGRPIGLALVAVAAAHAGTDVVIESADGAHPARVAPRSIYDPEGARLRV